MERQSPNRLKYLLDIKSSSVKLCTTFSHSKGSTNRHYFNYTHISTKIDTFPCTPHSIYLIYIQARSYEEFICQGVADGVDNRFDDSFHGICTAVSRIYNFNFF